MSKVGKRTKIGANLTLLCAFLVGVACSSPVDNHDYVSDGTLAVSQQNLGSNPETAKLDVSVISGSRDENLSPIGGAPAKLKNSKLNSSLASKKTKKNLRDGNELRSQPEPAPIQSDPPSLPGLSSPVAIEQPEVSLADPPKAATTTTIDSNIANATNPPDKVPTELVTSSEDAVVQIPEGVQTPAGSVAVPVRTTAQVNASKVDLPSGSQITSALTGKMTILFSTRTEIDAEGRPLPGVNDHYSFNLLAANSVRFSGTIKRKPRLVSRILSRETQSAELMFDVDVAVRNPSKPAEEKIFSEWIGLVPIDRDGHYQVGPKLSWRTIAERGTSASTGSFGGEVIGKSGEAAGLAATIRKYARVIGGRKVEVASSHIEPVKFAGLRLVAGPLGNNEYTTVYGNLDYDYDTGNWYTSGIEFRGADGGKDVITGSIKWNEDENRKSNGRGHYEFNLRFNEARHQRAEDESSFFEAATGEELFFAIDPLVPGIFGTVSYVDNFQATGPAAESKVISSKVVYDLRANNLSKEQIVNFTKLWLLIVGPINDE